MREILFRGKDVTGKWRESGAVFVRGDIALMITERPIKEIVKDKNGELVDVIFNFCAVDKETVGQFTGLTDKSGKKIFEGDIIKVVSPNDDEEKPFIEEMVEICFDEKERAYKMRGYIGAQIDEQPFDFSKTEVEEYQVEVIGNIHDNPELLKGEKE